MNVFYADVYVGKYRYRGKLDKYMYKGRPIDMYILISNIK